MRLNLPMRDLFSHMVMLGLAQIIEEESAEHVTVCWIDPQTAEIARLNGSAITLEEASEAVWKFKKKILLCCDEIEEIERMIIVGEDAKHKQVKKSPFVSRFPADLQDIKWKDYFQKRVKTLDEIDKRSHLLVRLIKALGFPSYWSLAKDKNDNRFDKNTSLWEMSPRYRGDEFFTSFYLELLKKAIDNLDVENISNRLSGSECVTAKKQHAPCGLHYVSESDACLCWIAYHGFALFPVRPVTQQTHGSVSLGVLENPLTKIFILPVPQDETPVTLNKYAAICRYEGLYRFIGDTESRLRERDRLWLNAHGISRLMAFECSKTLEKCPRVYALEGISVFVDRQQ